MITISGPDGYIYDPDGISGEKIDYMLELRSSGNDIVAPYAEQYPNATFVEGKRPWEVKADIALPCATQNELNGEDAQNLIKMTYFASEKFPIWDVPLKLSIFSLNIRRCTLRVKRSTQVV